MGKTDPTHEDIRRQQSMILVPRHTPGIRFVRNLSIFGYDDAPFGHAELVLSGGETIKVGPGSIELAEDLTGKGHITRTVGTEDRIAILIPVSDGK